MPILSYVVFTLETKKEVVVEKLNGIEGCSAVPADNKDLIILVTETESDEKDKQLQQQIGEIEEIQCLSMTYAHSV